MATFGIVGKKLRRHCGVISLSVEEGAGIGESTLFPEIFRQWVMAM